MPALHLMEHFGRWQVPRMMRNAINKYGITEVVTMEEKMLPDYWIPTGIGIMKFISPNDCNTNGGKIFDKVDVPLRYADILLMYAEALNELTPGSSYEVTTWQGEPLTVSRNKEDMRKGIRPVRMRAGVPDYEDSTYDDQILLRKKLIHERQVEFMGENQRYYELTPLENCTNRRI